jgi:hypothetical protein
VSGKSSKFSYCPSIPNGQHRSHVENDAASFRTTQKGALSSSIQFHLGNVGSGEVRS